MSENQDNNFLKKRALWLGVAILVIVIVAAFGGYSYSQMRTNKLVKSNPSITADREINNVVSRVKLLMDLPKDEQPAMITIIDKDKLANEAFFAEAETGDQVLVYGMARKVIIYRPKTNKIIEATTFTLPKTK